MVGKTNANFFIMTGERIDSKKAKELNIVSHVLETENFIENAIKIASKISTMSMYTLIAAKEAVRKAEELGIFHIYRNKRRLRIRKNYFQFFI